VLSIVTDIRVNHFFLILHRYIYERFINAQFFIILYTTRLYYLHSLLLNGVNTYNNTFKDNYNTLINISRVVKACLC